MMAVSLVLRAGCAGATSPPPPPPCPRIGADIISHTSLVHVIGSAKDNRARECAMDALGKLGRDAIPYWVGMLSHPDANLRAAVAARLLAPSPYRQIGPVYQPPIGQPDVPAAAIPHLIEVAASANFFYCGADGPVGGYVSDAGRTAIPGLIALLRDRGPEAGKTAARCLAELGPQQSTVAPDLPARIRSDGAALRWPDDLPMLAAIGIGADADADAFIASLDDGKIYSKDDRAAVPSALPPTIVPRIAARLDAIRKTSIWDAERFPYLHQTAGGRWVTIVLAKTRSRDAAALLVQDRAYDIISDMGAVAVPVLAERFAQSRDPRERAEIVAALARIGTPEALDNVRRDVPVLLPVLVANLHKHDAAFSLQDAARTDDFIMAQLAPFKSLGPLAREAAPELRAMLGSWILETRTKAAMALALVNAFDAEPAITGMRDRAMTRGRNQRPRQDQGAKEDAVYGAALDYLHNARGYLDSLPIETLAGFATRGLPSGMNAPEDAVFTALGRRGAAAVPALLDAFAFWSRKVGTDMPYTVNWGASRALLTLASLGADANAAFTQLVPYVNGDGVSVLSLASGSLSLAHMGWRTEEGMRLLFEQVVNNPNAAGRYYSAELLGDMGPVPDAMRGPLAKALRRTELWEHGRTPPDSLVFAVTGKAPPYPMPAPPLRADMDPVSVFLNSGHCRGDSYAPQEPPCERLRAQDDRAIAALLPLLRHDDARIRQDVGDYLGSRGREARSALPALRALLQDPSPLVRSSTSDNIGRIAGADAGVAGWLPYLQGALRSPDAEERHAALIQLGKFATLPEASLPALEQAVGDTRLADFRDTLLLCVAATHGQRATEFVIRRLEAADSQAGRDMATAALIAVGPAATPALLRRAAATTDIDLQIAYGIALAAQDTGPARAAVAASEARLLQGIGADLVRPDEADKWNLGIRRTAARRLNTMMRSSAAARALAARSLTDGDPVIRNALLAGFAEYGSPADLPLLDAADRFSVRTGGWGATGSMIDPAVARIRDRHPSVLERWQRCVWRLGGEDWRVRARCSAW